MSRNGCEAPEVCRSLEEATAGGDCFVIGGGQIYAEALPHADRVYATVIDAAVEGDVLFPELGPEWREVERSDDFEENGHVFSFRTYARG